MRFPGSTIARLLPLIIVTFVCALSSAGQTVAVLLPDKSDIGKLFAQDLANSLSQEVNVLDRSLAEAAFRAVLPDTPFNMTLEQGMTTGTAIGCDFFILIRADTLRRASFTRSENYESYAAVFVVSSRTGRLVSWKLESAEEATRPAAESRLRRTVTSLSVELSDAMTAAGKEEVAIKQLPEIQALPADNSPESRGFRSPAPYKRIKPEYTSTAALYPVSATVEVEMDLADDGRILRLDVVRWAGYGLERSVIDTVRSMNWRPAERNGKPIAIRVLLRYNFKKIEEQEP